MTAPDHEADALRAGVTASSTTGPAPPPNDAEQAQRRLPLFAYLQAPEHRTYLAIMRLFTSTLLADLSAGEVSSALAVAERDGAVAPGESDVDTVIDRLRQLVRWGNLVAGRRETIAASIAEFQHGSVRYQVSKLAVRVQRDVDDLLRVPEGAREVSRELLPAIERGLGEVDALLSEQLSSPADAGPGGRGERLAEQVTTVFLQHAELAATVRDFYAYLGQVVTRHQLAPEEISSFRNLLVEYIQMVVEDVLRHTPAIASSLNRLAARRAELVRLLAPPDKVGSDEPGSDEPASGADSVLGGDVERARGRTEADWQELTDWFVDTPGRPSQVASLREATARAIGSLLASVKRATSGGGLVPGRRAELLKLARWFDESDPARCQRLHAAAFGLHSARHLLPAPDYDSDNHDVAWRDGPVHDVTVNVRSRGDRGPRGRTSRVLDDPMTEESLLAEAREQDRRRGAAAAELAAAGPEVGGTRFSPDALSVLCELLTLAMAQREDAPPERGPSDGAPEDPAEGGPSETIPEDGAEFPGTALDPVHDLRVTVRHRPGERTEINSAAGTLTLEDTAVDLDAGVDPEAGAAAGAGEGGMPR